MLKKIKNKKNPLIEDYISCDDVIGKLKYIKPFIHSNLQYNTKKFYIFLITEKNFELFNKRLFPGKYLLKCYSDRSPLRNIPILLELSRYKLIPKIYFISSKLIIMKYLDFMSLSDILFNLTSSDFEIIYNNMLETIFKWHKLGFFHGDIGNYGNNILVDLKTLEVYFFDPGFEYFREFNLSSENIENQMKNDLKNIEKIKYNYLK